MTTERFSFTGTAGTNHYLAIFNAAGQVFDWLDSTFKALSSATTKATVGTEQADLGGTSKSAYIKDVDLSLLNSTSTPAKFRCDWYTDANATTRVSETEQFTVVSSTIAGLSSEETTKLTAVHSATTTAISELTGVPSATPTMSQILMWLLMIFRNKSRVTNNQMSIYNDAGTSIATQSIEETSTEFIRNKAS